MSAAPTAAPGAGGSDSCDTSAVIAYLAAAVITVVSFALGCTLSVDQVREVGNKKRALVIGWISQFGFMPVFAYAIARAAEYDTLLAIGCILCGCAPGGSTSNLFTYWSRGDVALSIVMSAASTICASFMIPLCVLVYIESTYTSDELKLNYGTLFITLALVIVPAGGGMILRNWRSQYNICGRPLWRVCELVGSALGGLFMIGLLVVAVTLQGEFIATGADVWIPALLFEPVGCAFGYWLATLAELDPKARRAVSLETGVQNFSLVIAVVSLTYKDDCEKQERALVFPYVASVGYIINSAWICAAYNKISLTTTEDTPNTSEPVKQAVSISTV